jgi:hypothetical protein
VVAYIHDGRRSRESLAETEKKIRRGETAFEPWYERFEVGSFTVMVLVRRPPSERLAWGRGDGERRGSTDMPPEPHPRLLRAQRRRRRAP